MPVELSLTGRAALAADELLGQAYLARQLVRLMLRHRVFRAVSSDPSSPFQRGLNLYDPGSSPGDAVDDDHAHHNGDREAQTSKQLAISMPGTPRE